MTRSASASSRLRAAMNSSGSPVSAAEHAAGDALRWPASQCCRDRVDLVQVGVVDRGAGRGGDGRGQDLVLVVELPAPALGQIEVAEHLVAHPDRYAEEACPSADDGAGNRRAGIVGGEVAGSRSGRGSSIRAPSRPLPFGRCPIKAPPGAAGIPSRNEFPPACRPGLITPSAAYRAPISSRTDLPPSGATTPATPDHRR